MRKPLLAVFVLALCHVPALSAAAQRVFVADQTAGTIHQYSVNGDDLGVFAGGLAAPSWITADSAGSIYVSEYNQGGPDSQVFLLGGRTPEHRDNLHSCRCAGRERWNDLRGGI